MAGELTSAELRDLLGAYALDAVDDDERARIERYLAGNAAARDEVAELQEAAAVLAHAGGDAPAGLWDKIASELGPEAASGLPPLAFVDVRRGAAARIPSDAEHEPVPVVALVSRHRSISVRIVAAIGVAAAIVIGALAVKVVQLDDRVGRVAISETSDSVQAAARAARNDPRARQVVLASADRARQAEVVYLPDGTGYLEEQNLPELPDGRTYQLWVLVGDAEKPIVISAGVLGRRPGVTAFHFTGPVIGFVVTEEQAPGVVSSNSPALLQGVLDA